ncbi:shikimate kinase [Vulgatibacter sp.]|uniref:shikimate kinase n=1 Tax=Vulgatibacter sp. TaxID=1971226 RepID=UPI003565642A
MDRLLTQLGLRVRLLRLEQGLSLRQLAERSGVSERYLSELEAGRGNISVLRLSQVAAALGQSGGALLLDAERGARAGSARVVALLGLRGAGKSTIGPRLASRLQLPFFELDGLIEAAAGLTVGEIFALHGEATYRRLELEALRRFLVEQPAAVLATGGGIVGHEEAFALLQDRAVTVWLRAHPDDHWDRVVGQGDVRPMADNPAARRELRAILGAREPLYSRARHVVDTSALGLGGSVDALVSTLSGS